MAAIKGIVFDLDGTLLDTIDGIMSAFNTVLERRGFAARSKAFFLREVGWGLPHLMDACLPHVTHEEKIRIGNEMKISYLDTWQEGTRLFPGIADLLTWLDDRALPLAIFTNKPLALAERTLEIYFKDWNFVLAMGPSETVPAKPDPTGLEIISDHFHIPTQEILMIGDSAVDVETARGAGAQSLGVTWGFKSRTELETSGAGHILDHPWEIITFIQKNHV
ncbi:MAG: HAD family hydrolase [Fidelibacterota bacterium]